MTQFNIQFHTTDEVDFSSITNLYQNFTIEKGADYQNIEGTVEDPHAFWETVKTNSLIHQYPTIAVCEGEDGWNDYYLLHHFKKDITIDEFDIKNPV